MVSLPTVHASNAHLPTHLTAVFVGGTSGIGLYTLLALARHCANPTIYIVGRSQSAATRILSDLKSLNTNGKYHFIQSDVSLIKNVDAVCEELRHKEKSINMLVQSQGTLSMGTETAEGMHAAASLILHSRMRFTLNLLPLLKAAEGLKRVVSVFTGTKEGPITTSDLQMRTLKNPMKARATAASCVTLLLEEAARRAPEVSFVHTFPGWVSTDSARSLGTIASVLMKTVEVVLGPWFCVPPEECGERHLYAATSDRFPSLKENRKEGEVAIGTNGSAGSGVYVIDERCESGAEGVVKVLQMLREEGKGEWVWGEVKRDMDKITGKESL